MNEKIKFYKQRLQNLQTDRSNFDSQWEEAAQLIIPADRDRFASQGMNVGLGTQGEKKTEYQFDATPGLACHRFASVMESISTPQNSKWHFLAATDKMLKRNRRVREYLEDVTAILFQYRYRPGAGFVTNLQQCYLSLGAYGNGVVYVDQPENGRGLRYRAIHLGESYLAESHAHLVDTVYRPFYLTARQAVAKFGSAVPKAVAEAAAQPTQQEQKFRFMHVVEPRDNFVPGMIGPQGRPWSGPYLSLDPEEMFIDGGYSSFPYAIMRYTQNAGETYGRGPGQWVLPAIKLLNEQKKTVLKQGHRTVDPILLAHDDGALDGFVMRSGYLNKGGMNADGKMLVGTLPVGRIDVGDKMMEMERSVINDAFLISLFQILVENPQMTATEVLERMKEKGMLLAPMAGRIQDEFLGPLIDREVDLLSMQGLLPPMPSILAQAGAEYKVEYDSPLTRMQRAEGAGGFIRTLNTIAEYVKFTGDPAPLDHINFDKATPDLLEINAAPVAWTATEEEVAAKRAARQQAADVKQMTDAAPGAAALMKAMPKGAVAA